LHPGMVKFTATSCQKPQGSGSKPGRRERQFLPALVSGIPD
jgi:hypothetical protein